jgi:hypothetical protein
MRAGTPLKMATGSSNSFNVQHNHNIPHGYDPQQPEHGVAFEWYLQYRRHRFVDY